MFYWYTQHKFNMFDARDMFDTPKVLQIHLVFYTNTRD